MKLAGNYTFNAPVSVVWTALFDPEVLARTLPGCEKLEKDGQDFVGEISVKMGPVQGKFHGRVQLEDVVEPEHYTMLVDSRGPAGFAKAKAHIRLSPEGTGTRLEYDSEVNVGGKMATVGQRLLDASSRAIVKQSLESLHLQIQDLAQQVAAPTPPREQAVPTEATTTLVSAEVAPAEPPIQPAPAPTPLASPRPHGHAAPAMTQGAFAMGVAKELTRELIPPKAMIGIAVAAVAIVVYFLLV